MIDVLLISPRSPTIDSPRNGDQTYTDLLLQYPPPGVRYHHYVDLIAAGMAGRTRTPVAASYYLTRLGVLPPDMWFEAIESDFVPDLVHICGFSAVIRLPRGARRVPLVLGASVGSFSDLKYYLEWKEERVRRARERKRAFHRLVGAHDASLNPDRAARILVWSRFSQQMHIEEGYVDTQKIEVLYPGLPIRWNGALDRRSADKTTTFLFVGGDFMRKNGELLLQAFRRLHADYPETNLLMVTEVPGGAILNEPGVLHYRFIPHDELLERIYPAADVLVLPSKAEGFGLVILEAMSFGIPAIAVNAWAMPEIITDGENGFLISPESVDELSARMQQLARNPELVEKMRAVSRSTFLERFSLEVHNTRLRSVYSQLLEETEA